MRKIQILAVVLTVCLSGVCLGDKITVGKGGWEEFDNIQDAIDDSISGDIIEVQPGTYNERINFYGKAITVTGTDPENINVVYATVVDGGDTGKVVTFDSGEDGASIFTGLTVQNGDGGIYFFYSEPLISNCVIRYNNASGIHGSSSSPTIIDCVVRENHSYGISNCNGQISNCIVTENSSSGISDCDGTITNCKIYGNSGHGLNSCDGPITYCTISGNSGRGLQYCDGDIKHCIVSGNLLDGLSSCSGTIMNCTIVGNKGNGHSSGNAILSNNIIVLNWEYGIKSSATLKYNNVWGNLNGNYNNVAPGGNDTHENPRFAIDGFWDVDVWIEGEYYLKSIAGRWDPNIPSWVNDEITSPCIDAGDPTSGVFYEPSPNGGRINQGAYGNTIYASRSPWGPEAYCRKFPPGDVNFDCKVNMIDFAILASHWLECNLVPKSACWK